MKQIGLKAKLYCHFFGHDDSNDNSGDGDYQATFFLDSPIEPGWRLDYIAMPKGKLADKARDEKNISMMKI